MYRFKYNKEELDKAKEKYFLNDLQVDIIKYRISNYSLIKIASLTNCSVSTITRELRKLYDILSDDKKMIKK